MNKHARKAALAAGMCLSLIGISTSQALAAPAEFYASQQVKKVSGVIIDASGIPVIGANVLEKGTTNGVITDLDGNFTLNVKPGATLVITYIGYVSQEIEIGNQTTFKITLKEDSEMLDEVVVVGYGTMKKSDLSGASVSMDEDAIKGSVITNLDQSLQGRAAGVAAVSTSGAPGSASSIRVRGQATINSNAEPLYVRRTKRFRLRTGRRTGQRFRINHLPTFYHQPARYRIDGNLERRFRYRHLWCARRERRYLDYHQTW